MPRTDVLVRLVEGDTLLLDARLSRLLHSLDGTTTLSEATVRAGLSPGEVRRWRQTVQTLLGADPLERTGSRLRPSAAGRGLRREYERENAALRVHLATGLRVPLLAVDGIALHEGRLVAIQRRHFPHREMYSLPGGIVEYGETTEEAVVREVGEETGLRTRVGGLVGVYSRPDRDPRGHVISVAYTLEVVGGALRSGSDAAAVALLDLEALPEMGFDHRQLVADALAQGLLNPGR